MTLSTLDPVPALVVVDLQRGIAGRDTTPHPVAEVVARSAELAGHPEDAVVTKRNVGAFVGTDLDLQLRRRRVTQVLLTGIATSMGVEGTARAAHDHGYHVVPVTDAMADTDEATHHHSVAAIFGEDRRDHDVRRGARRARRPVSAAVYGDAGGR